VSPMRAWNRRVLLLAACAALAVAAWRIVAHTVADALAGHAPQRALQWMPGHPAALLGLAERQLADGEPAAAAATARRLLARAPLEGRAWRILGQSEDARGRVDAARGYYLKAIASSPHDIAARAWLLRDHLAHGRYDQALAEIDRILRIAPQLNPVLVPVLARMATDPRFADAIVPMLARQPKWRTRFLGEIQTGRYPQSERVIAGLQASGGLSREEHQRWIEALMKQKRWDEAYAHWVTLLPAGTRLSPVFNGGFESPVGGYGFDWRVERIPGVSVQFRRPEGDASGGLAANVRFNRRPAAHAGLQQALLLAPGRYRFQARMRAESLRSDSGLEWAVLCMRGGRLLGASERIQGSFGWTVFTWDAEVPADCPAQWLRLRNPVASGVGQYVAGELWLDDVSAARPDAGENAP